MTLEEKAKSVIGYEGLYMVDSLGNVYRQDGKVLIQHKNKFGYMNVMLRKDGKQKQHKVHRLVAQAFIPNPQGKEQVNHIDGDKTNNAVWNLEWVTPKENVNHAFRTGLNIQKGNNKTPVLCVETGIIYPSVKRASEDMGIISTSIFNVLSGLSENARGYHFRRAVQ